MSKESVFREQSATVTVALLALAKIAKARRPTVTSDGGFTKKFALNTNLNFLKHFTKFADSFIKKIIKEPFF